MQCLIAVYLTFCAAAIAYLIRMNLIIEIRLRAVRINPSRCLCGASPHEQLWALTSWKFHHFYPDLTETNA